MKDRERFLADILPLVQRNAMVYALRGGYDLEYREEFMAEIAAIAWESWLKAKRDDLHAGHFWWVAMMRWRSRRRFACASINARVLPPMCPLEDADSDGLLCGERDPASQAIFNLDYAAFRNCLSAISQRLLTLKLAGYSVADAARMSRLPYDKADKTLRNLRKPAALFFQAA